MLDDKTLAELDEAEKKATPGPWHNCGRMLQDNQGQDILLDLGSYGRSASNAQFTAKFIALARNHMHALLDLVQFQKEEIQALTHEGRQGELEQANVGLADENEKLRASIEHLGKRHDENLNRNSLLRKEKEKLRELEADITAWAKNYEAMAANALALQAEIENAPWVYSHRCGNDPDDIWDAWSNEDPLLPWDTHRARLVRIEKLEGPCSTTKR